MKSIRVLLVAAALMAAACLAGARLAPAQETMTFRPVPPESVSLLERSSRVTKNRQRGVKVEVGTHTGGVIVSDTDPAVPGVQPAPPDLPEIPRPEPRETRAEIVRFGGDIEVERDQAVNGDVVSFGGDIRIDGVVRGSVTAMGGDVTLTSSAVVDEDVVCMGGTLREQPGSVVRGRRVTGPASGHSRLWFPMFNLLGTGVKVATHVFMLLLWLALAFLIVKLAPGRTGAALETLRREAGMSFVIGLLILALIIPSVIVLALVIAILCITIIGIPLAAAVAVGYAAFFLVAAVWGLVVGYTQVGSLLFGRLKGGTATMVMAALWGVVALHAIRIVGDLFHAMPLFGFLGGLLGFMYFTITALLVVFGAGALVRSEYRRRTVQEWWRRVRGRPAREDEVPPPPAPEPPGDPMAPPASPIA